MDAMYCILVQEVLRRQGKPGRLAADLHIDRRIHLDIDVIRSGDRIGGLHVNGDQLQAQLIHSFQERKLHAGLSDNDLLTQAGNNKGRIRGRFLISGEYNDNY